MDKNDKVIQAAKLYYMLDCTQNEIAKKLGVSRPTVSRMLQTAKREGIVQIKICEKAERLTDLETELEQKYGLKRQSSPLLGNMKTISSRQQLA